MIELIATIIHLYLIVTLFYGTFWPMTRDMHDHWNGNSSFGFRRPGETGIGLVFDCIKHGLGWPISLSIIVIYPVVKEVLIPWLLKPKEGRRNRKKK